jgi:enoyl-[acyl-carrier protein] reductase I
MMIDYSIANAPLQKELSAGNISIRIVPCNNQFTSIFWLFAQLSQFSYVTEEVGNAAAFLSSPLASAITGTVLYVDNGLNAMGVGVDSPIFSDLDIPKEQH